MCIIFLPPTRRALVSNLRLSLRPYDGEPLFLYRAEGFGLDPLVENPNCVEPKALDLEDDRSKVATPHIRTFSLYTCTYAYMHHIPTIHVESICLQPSIEPSALGWKSHYLPDVLEALGLEPLGDNPKCVELKALGLETTTQKREPSARSHC